MIDPTSTTSRDVGDASNGREYMRQNEIYSLENGTFTTTQKGSKKVFTAMLLSHHGEQLGGTSDSSEENPRNWAQNRKFAIAFFVIFSAFVG
jgi:hypothetical protein